MSTTLHQKTLNLLESSDESTDEIAKKADVSFYWLRKFRSGVFTDPGVSKVQKVYEYLSGKSLL